MKQTAELRLFYDGVDGKILAGTINLSRNEQGLWVIHPSEAKCLVKRFLSETDMEPMTVTLAVKEDPHDSFWVTVSTIVVIYSAINDDIGADMLMLHPKIPTYMLHNVDGEPPRCIEEIEDYWFHSIETMLDRFYAQAPTTDVNKTAVGDLQILDSGPIYESHSDGSRLRVVLARTENHHHPYVTWIEKEKGSGNATYFWGRYHRNLEDARENFMERVAKNIPERFRK